MGKAYLVLVENGQRVVEEILDYEMTENATLIKGFEGFGNKIERPEPMRMRLTGHIDKTHIFFTRTKKGKAAWDKFIKGLR